MANTFQLISLYIMKTKLSFLLLILCTLLSCDKSESVDMVTNPISIDGFIHRKVHYDGSLVIVSSNQVLRQVLPDDYQLYQEKVDFSKGNLLLIYGTSTSGVSDIVKKQTMVDDKYNYEITVCKNLTAVMDSWCIAYIIPKNVTKQNINLQIEYQSTEL